MRKQTRAYDQFIESLEPYLNIEDGRGNDLFSLTQIRVYVSVLARREH